MLHTIRQALGILLAITIPAFSWGYSIYIPQGYREALMANTGLAMNATEGAAIYNPAGAGGLEAARISAGASLINAAIFKIEAPSSIGSVSDKNPNPSFTQIPGLITGYQKFTWGRAGFFINTDYSMAFDKLITFSSAYGTSYTEMVANINSFNVGFIYANSAVLSGDLKFQYGLTTSFAMVENQQSMFSKGYVEGTNSYISGFSNTNVKTTNLLTRLGTLLASEKYSVGAYYQPKGTSISSTYSKFAYQVASTGSVVDESENSGPPLLMPEAYGLGVGLQVGENLRLYVDTNIMAPQGVDRDSFQRDRIESLGLGGDYTLASGTHVFAGLSHAIAKSENKTENRTLSAGFDYRISFIKNYVGFYHSSIITPINNESGTTGSSFDWFGILLASQYAF